MLNGAASAKEGPRGSRGELFARVNQTEKSLEAANYQEDRQKDGKTGSPVGSGGYSKKRLLLGTPSSKANDT